MIRKPTAEWVQKVDRRSARARAVSNLFEKRRKISGGADRVMQGSVFALHGTVLLGFGALWLVTGIGSLLAGSIATFVGAGGMGMLAIWGGRRLLRKSRAMVRPSRQAAQDRDAAGDVGARAAAQPAPEVAPDRIVSFDPEAIIARHLAEKARLTTAARPEPVPIGPPGRTRFGRKVA